MDPINKYNYFDKIVAFVRNKELLKHISIVNKDILDFGCGSNFNNIFKRYKTAKNVFLIDRIGKSFKFNQYQFLNYDGDLNSIKKFISEKKLDFIIMSAIIEHMDKPEITINFLKQFLNPQGMFLITAPSVHSKWLLEFMAFRLKIINSELVKEHKRYYNLSEYEALAKKTNLKLEKFYFFEFKLNTFAILK